MKDLAEEHGAASALDRAHGWVARRVSARTIRTFAAFASGLLTSFASSGGLLHALPAPQGALLVGLAAGSLAPGAAVAAPAAFAASLLGAIAGPWILTGGAAAPSVWTQAGWALVAAVVAGVAASIAERPGVRRAVAWGAVALVVVNVWLTPLTLNSGPTFDPATQQRMSPLFEQLDGRIPISLVHSDEYFFLRVLRRMDLGTGYYTAYSEEQVNHYGPKAPLSSPVMVRLPTLFWIWRPLPGVGRDIPLLYLALVSVAVASVPVLLRRVVCVPFVIPAACLVASYLLFAAVSVSVLDAGAWGGALALVAAALLSWAARSRRLSAEVSAAAVALFAALVREMLVFVTVAALISSTWTADALRRVRIRVWVAALGGFLVAYAAHWYAVRPFLKGPGSPAAYLKGGVGNILAALSWGATFFYGREWLVPALALLGFVGMTAIRDDRLRRFALLATALPLAAFLVVGNGAVNPETMRAENYWGAMVLPLMLAFSPAAFAWLPGFSASTEARARAGQTGSRLADAPAPDAALDTSTEEGAHAAES